jgi:transcriptional regulator GlxA family with amidase domain
MTLTPMKTCEIRQRTLALPDVDSRTNSREAREIRKIEESIGYMMRHLDRSLRVSTLATEVNISPSHFFYLFKRHVGSTPIDYFIRLRLRHACHLLEETEMSVKAIAYTLGYDDPFYFSRIFKSVHRMAPSKYRLQKRRAREDNQGLPVNHMFSRFVPVDRGFRSATLLTRPPTPPPTRRCP